VGASAQAQHAGRVVDPVLAVLGVVALVSVPAVLMMGGVGPVAELADTAVWLVFVWLCRQVGRMPGAAREVRAFWRTVGVGGVLFALAHLLYAIARAVGAPSKDPVRLAAMAFIAAAVATVGWAFLASPLRVSGRDRPRLLLDVATVMAALTMLAWYVWLPEGSPEGDAVQGGFTLLACVLALVGLTAGAKLRLSGSAPWTVAAGVVLAAGVLVGAWSLFNLVSLSPGEVHLVYAGQLATAFLYAAGARVQRLQMRTRPAGRTLRRRAVHSPLPYLAIVAALTMLVAVLWREGLTVRGWGMVVGVVVVSVLVMLRQNLAFAENGRLLRRLRAAMRDMRNQEERFRSLVQNASDLTLLVGTDGTIRYASPAMRDLLGVDPRQAIGQPLPTVLAPEEAPVVEQLIADVRARPKAVRRAQLRVRHTDRWLEAVATNRLAASGVGGIIINIRDVTEARLFADRLREQATHDELTGLPNRVLLNERVQLMGRGLSGVQRQNAVLMLDLDDFKAVNDELGHQTGDGLLVAVAQCLLRSVRPTDIAARLGGDEFVVLLTDTTRDGAVATAQRILAALAEPVTVGEHRLSAGASIGVALGSADQFDALLRDADVAMYQAKRDTTGVRVHVAARTAAPRTSQPTGAADPPDSGACEEHGGQPHTARRTS
jgi:diguanylate cyclase (GGDEF)-like protein/PAS domain S-box-containing protein